MEKKFISFREYVEDYMKKYPSSNLTKDFYIIASNTIYNNNIKYCSNEQEIYSQYAFEYIACMLFGHGNKDYCFTDLKNRAKKDKNIDITEEKLLKYVIYIYTIAMYNLDCIYKNNFPNDQQQEQSQQQQQQPIVTEASAANYSISDAVNKFIPVKSSAPQTIELTDARKAEYIMNSDVFKNSVKLDSKINAEVYPQQILNIWEIIHSDVFKNYLYTKGIPINVSYKQVVNDHVYPNLNMKFEIIGSNGNVLYIGDERRYIVI